MVCLLSVHMQLKLAVLEKWIKKGSRKEIRSNAGRSKVNVLGMLNIPSHKDPCQRQ